MVLFEVNIFKNTPKIKKNKHHKWIDKTIQKEKQVYLTKLNKMSQIKCFTSSMCMVSEDEGIF